MASPTILTLTPLLLLLWCPSLQADYGEQTTAPAVKPGAYEAYTAPPVTKSSYTADPPVTKSSYTDNYTEKKEEISKKEDYSETKEDFSKKKEDNYKKVEKEDDDDDKDEKKRSGLQEDKGKKGSTKGYKKGFLNEKGECWCKCNKGKKKRSKPKKDYTPEQETTPKPGYG